MEKDDMTASLTVIILFCIKLMMHMMKTGGS